MHCDWLIKIAQDKFFNIIPKNVNVGTNSNKFDAIPTGCCKFFTLETTFTDYVSSMGASHGLPSLPAICTAPHSPYVFLQTKVCCQKMKL